VLIRRATEDDIRAALEVANVQFDGNLRFKELEDLSGPRVPDAIIESGSMHLQGGRYRGARGFLLNFASVGANNVGSQIAPIPFEASCNCDEHDTDYIDIETLTYLGYETAIPGGTHA
jgi:hypothetical protein